MMMKIGINCRYSRGFEIREIMMMYGEENNVNTAHSIRAGFNKLNPIMLENKKANRISNINEQDCLPNEPQ